MRKGINLYSFYRRTLNVSYNSQKCFFSTKLVSQHYKRSSHESEKLTSEEYFGKMKKNYEDTFGDLDSFEMKFQRIKEDPEDIKEYERSKMAPGKKINEYISDLQEHLSKHDYESAIRVLEVDMVNDRKRLVPHIYEILISYNAQKGDLKEAYRLYVEFKRRQGRVTGAMYTSLFNACANSKNSFDALQKAHTIRESLMNDQNHKVNIINYNAMLKAFGRHADLMTAFKIFDEVLERRDKVRPETYSFLMAACISDKNSGLRFALMVWRKMLQSRVKPDVFNFNLMLRCVAECSFGEATLLNDFIREIQSESKFFLKRKTITKRSGTIRKVLKIQMDAANMVPSEGNSKLDEHDTCEMDKSKNLVGEVSGDMPEEEATKEGEENVVLKSNLVEQMERGEDSSVREPELPNLLALETSVGSVIDFKVMTDPCDRFKCLGGKKGFLKVMSDFKVEPNKKTFTLLLAVIPETKEAEDDLIKEAHTRGIKLDTIFYNKLLQRRIYRHEADLIPETLKQMQAEELSPDVVTFGVLANSCATRESGVALIENVRSFGLRLNEVILNALLKSADSTRDLGYVMKILEAAKEDNVQLGPRFASRLRLIIKREKRMKAMEEENGRQVVNSTALPFPCAVEKKNSLSEKP